MRFSRTPLDEELNCSITIIVSRQQHESKVLPECRQYWHSGIKGLHFKNARKMMKIQGGQKFSDSLEQTTFGAESHSHAEIKSYGQWAWRGSWNKSGGTTSEECRVVSRREREGDDFPRRKWRNVRVGSRCFAARSRIWRMPSLVLEKENLDFV